MANGGAAANAQGRNEEGDGAPEGDCGTEEEEKEEVEGDPELKPPLLEMHSMSRINVEEYSCPRTQRGYSDPSKVFHRTRMHKFKRMRFNCKVHGKSMVCTSTEFFDEYRSNKCQPSIRVLIIGESLYTIEWVVEVATRMCSGESFAKTGTCRDTPQECADGPRKKGRYC